MKNVKNETFMASAWLVLGVLARLIPHPANVSPLTSISLFGGAQLTRRAAFLLTFVTLVLTDLLLASIHGFQAFGYWTIFTYTGFAAMIFAGSFLRNASALRTGGFIVGSSLGFWLWTNFGIWVTGDHGMYTRDLAGLTACYANALPFLQNALLGDLAWGAAFFLGFRGVRVLAPRFGGASQAA